MNELLGTLPLDDGNKATASSLLDSANVIKCGGRVDLGGTGTELLQACRLPKGSIDLVDVTFCISVLEVGGDK